MTAVMRAIGAEAPGGPDSLVLRTVPVPEPGPGQARIRVAYSALNPLDTHARADRIKWGHPGFPFVPGYEYAGHVKAVGPGVDPTLVGRRVAAMSEWGGSADFALSTDLRGSCPSRTSSTGGWERYSRPVPRPRGTWCIPRRGSPRG